MTDDNATQSLSRGRRYAVLAICCMSLLIVGMDATIVNVALPSIARDLNAGVSDLQWIVDAYTVVLASLLILSGSTADRLGRKRTFQVGLVLFTAASLLCSAAPSLSWLIGFRILQALGGSMLNPVAMSIITNVFTDPKERARAIGVWGGVIGLSLGLGPLVGGVLIDSIGWPAIFWINVPIGIAAVILTALYVPESRAPHARRIDPLGQVLVITLLGSVTYAIIESPRASWSSLSVLVPAAMSVAAVISLIPYELRRDEPLIDVRFFRSVPFSGATAIAVCGFGAYSGFLFLSTLYLQDVRGLSPLQAGLMTTPMAVMVVVGAPLSGRMVGARGPRVPLLVAGVLQATGAAFLLGLSGGTSYLTLIAGYTVFAAGFALVNPPITNTAVSGMPLEQSGVAAALASTSRQVGTTLGVAVIGSIVNPGATSAVGSQLLANAPVAVAVVMACGCAVTVLGVLTTTAKAKRSAVRTAEQLGNADMRASADAAAVAA